MIKNQNSFENEQLICVNGFWTWVKCPNGFHYELKPNLCRQWDYRLVKDDENNKYKSKTCRIR